MAHHIYHTEGIILRSRPRGEANSLLSIFTRELGLIEAVAQGVRLSKSKLKASLQEYSIGTFEVVRGKQTWRLTNVVEDYNLYIRIRDKRELFLAVSRVLALLVRLLSGEETNLPLFEMLMDMLAFAQSKEFSAEEIKAIEYISVWRTLLLLGYGKDVPELRQFSSNEWSETLLSEMLKVSPLAATEINKALKETHL